MKKIVRMYKVPVRKFSLNIPKCCYMPRPDYGPMEVQRSELMNGMKIAAAKACGSLISSCTVMFRAGSRYESDYIGASHFIRATASAAGEGCTAYSKMRVLQQNGASLTCSSDRENIAFTLRCMTPLFSELKYYLLDTAARCCYNDWDIDDRRPLVREDLYRVHPEQRVIDLVQRALWAGPVGNSIFCEEERIEEMSQTRLCCFAKTNLRSIYCTVASVGVPFDETMMLADKIEPRREKPPERSTVDSRPRTGFEYYDLGRDHDTWIAVAVPGCGTNNLDDLMKHALVAAACGTGKLCSGQHDVDRTLQPPLGLIASSDLYTEIKAFNISYCDSGTFGIVAKTRACSAMDVAFAVKEFLSNVGDLTCKQLEVGKNRLKLSLLLHDEDYTKVSEGLALQLANNVQIDNTNDAICMIDKIHPDEISATAKLLTAKCNQMAVAVVGDVSSVPHDQELLSKM